MCLASLGYACFFPTLAKPDRAASHQLTSYRVPADSKMEEKLCVGLNPVDYCKSSFVSVAESFNMTIIIKAP